MPTVLKPTVSILQEYQFVPLASKQIVEKQKIKELYEDFWNNLKFSNGWEKPHFTREEVEAELDLAAEAVVRIRSHLDQKDSPAKFRLIEGSSREYLHSLSGKPKNRKRFVRALVKATFRDEKGYVEGLTGNEIDQFLDRLWEYHKQVQQQKKEDIRQSLKATWESTESAMKQLFASDLFQTMDSSQISNRALHQIQLMQKSLRNLQNKAEDLLQKQPEMSDDTSSDKRGDGTSSGGITENEAEDKRDPMETETNVPMSPSESTNQSHEQPQQPKQDLQAMEEQNTSQPQQAVEQPKQDLQAMEEQNTSQPQQQPKQDLQAMEEENTSQPQQLEPKQPMDQQSNQDQQVEPPKAEEKESAPKDDESMIKLKVVADEVKEMRTRIQDLEQSASKLDFDTLVTQEGSEKLVEGLQKKCLQYAEGLMTDLLKLDSIVSSPESRPVRKEQVKNIQSMMEDLDSLKQKLHKLVSQLREKRKEEDEKRKKEEEQLKRKREEEEIQDQEKAKKLQEPKKEEPKIEQTNNESNKMQTQREAYLQKRNHRLKEKWQQLKLNPKFQVEEARDAYLIQGYIPGMKKENIKINLSPDQHHLTVEGVREPTPEEEEQMRTQLRARLQADMQLKSQLHQFTPEDEDMLVLRSGLGRFGRFSETYQLPSSVDPEKIDATYEKGVLRVIIPKLQIRPRPVPSPFGQFRGGHFQDPFVFDQDSWW